MIWFPWRCSASLILAWWYTLKDQALIKCTAFTIWNVHRLCNLNYNYPSLQPLGVSLSSESFKTAEEFLFRNHCGGHHGQREVGSVSSSSNWVISGGFDILKLFSLVEKRLWDQETDSVEQAEFSFWYVQNLMQMLTWMEVCFLKFVASFHKLNGYDSKSRGWVSVPCKYKRFSHGQYRLLLQFHGCGKDHGQYD